MAHSLSNALQNHTVVPQQQSQVNKINQQKYNIWTDSLQEEALLENLKGCDVNSSNQLSSNTVKRSVESYNYTLKYRLDGGNILKRRMSSTHSADELIIDNCFAAVTNKRFRNNFNKKKNSNVRLRLGSYVVANNEYKTSVVGEANSGGSGSSSCGIIGNDDRNISDDSSSNDSHGNMFQSRFISDLSILDNYTDKDLARDIANKLYEEKDDLLCK